MNMMEYYSAFKNEEILPYETKWTKLEVVLSEVSQPQKDKYCTIPLIWGISVVKPEKQRADSRFPEAGGERNGELPFNRHKASVKKTNNF